MRIKILAGGGGTITQLQSGLSSLHDNICDTIDSLKNVSDKINNLNGGMQKLSDANNSIQLRIQSEIKKRDAVQNVLKKTDIFLSNTIRTDQIVAQQVSNSQEKFYGSYSWLRPTTSIHNNNWLKRGFEKVKKCFKTAEEALNDAWHTVKEFVKEHAIEIIVGTAALAVATVLTVLSGGTLGPLFAGVLVSMFVSGGIEALVAVINGEDVLTAFGNGLASGYMFGGLFAMGGSVITTIKFVQNGGKLSLSNSFVFNKKLSKPININLKYKDGWTAAQKREARKKIKALSKAKTVKTPVNRNGTLSASSRYKSAYGEASISKGYDIDHIIDLQLGGIDDILNMKPLDKSVNRSLGIQIKNAIKDYPFGTKFGKFTIS